MEDIKKLNIVDESGNIIGEEPRENIHKNGLLHREIHVWFYTPSGEIIFQHRAKDKDTFPDLLDATAGGHVEIGMDFEDSALKEAEEETGIPVTSKDLRLIRKIRSKSYDPVTGNTNNVIRAVYAYKYDGNIEDLKIENGKALGFEAWHFKKIFNSSETDKKKIIPKLMEGEYLEIFREIIEELKK